MNLNLLVSVPIQGPLARALDSNTERTSSEMAKTLNFAGCINVEWNSETRSINLLTRHLPGAYLNSAIIAAFKMVKDYAESYRTHAIDTQHEFEEMQRISRR